MALPGNNGLNYRHQATSRRHQAITWTNVDLLSLRPLWNIHCDNLSPEIALILILYCCPCIYFRVTIWLIKRPSHYFTSCDITVIICLCNSYFVLYRITCFATSVHAIFSMSGDTVNSLWPSDAISHYRSWSSFVHIMACCLTAPSHYLTQFGLITD